MNTKLITLSSLFIITPLAHGFGFNDITNWTGSGTNRAALLVDWQDGSTHPSLVWGYRWDGTATGEQMVQAITASDPRLTIHITSYSFGDAIDEFRYAGPVGTHDQVGFGPGSAGFWDYFTGSGAAAVPIWTESSVGAGARTLTDESWDGWSWAANFVTTPPSAVPIAAPVPEPSSILALAAGGLMLLMRKPRRDLFHRKNYRDLP